MTDKGAATITNSHRRGTSGGSGKRWLRMLSLAVLIVVAASLSLAESRPGAAAGGLQNPGFESGLTGWSVSAADVGQVVGAESSAQCPTYADMGNVTVQPYRGAKALRLGTCKRINESQNKGLNTA